MLGFDTTVLNYIFSLKMKLNIQFTRIAMKLHTLKQSLTKCKSTICSVIKNLNFYLKNHD